MRNFEELIQVLLSDTEKTLLIDLLKLKIKSYALQIKAKNIEKSKVTRDNYYEMFIDAINKELGDLKFKYMIFNSILKKLNEVSA